MQVEFLISVIHLLSLAINAFPTVECKSFLVLSVCRVVKFLKTRVDTIVMGSVTQSIFNIYIISLNLSFSININIDPRFVKKCA